MPAQIKLYAQYSKRTSDQTEFPNALQLLVISRDSFIAATPIYEILQRGVYFTKITIH